MLKFKYQTLCKTTELKVHQTNLEFFPVKHTLKKENTQWTLFSILLLAFEKNTKVTTRYAVGLQKKQN